MKKSRPFRVDTRRWKGYVGAEPTNETKGGFTDEQHESITSSSLSDPLHLPGKPHRRQGYGARTPLAEGTAKAAARDLGDGWKVNPYLYVEPGEVLTLGEIEGSGVIRHIWLTPTGDWRSQILRIYWDGSDVPAVECPLGDFFACGWGQYAQFRRVNPLPYKQNYTILDGICGRGQYVGTYMAWGVNNTGWWGEGEIRFYMDGDREYPTICGTGTEDYFCGSYNFENPQTHQYQTFTTPYSGLCQVIRPDGVYAPQTRFGLYR